jgi:hypothetical protein
MYCHNWIVSSIRDKRGFGVSMYRTGDAPLENQSFQFVLQRLIAWCEKFSLPAWDKIEVIEDPLDGPVKPVTRVPAETYDARFQEIMEHVNKDWVNVGVAEVIDGVLIVDVEYNWSEFKEEWPNDAHTMSVNFHGPSSAAFARMGIDWDFH